MTECPKLNKLDSNIDVVTTENASQLRITTYTRKVGTEVELSCLEGYKLVGQIKVICRTGLTWDYSTKPSCQADASSSDGLSDSMKILIGALVGGVLLFVLVVILIACIFRRKKKKSSEQEKYYRHLQDEAMPKGHKPGEMIHETQYRSPSYASAWPALTHSSMIDKREYPFRHPDSETSRNSLHTGKSTWDNNDYFFGKADIPSATRGDNYVSNTSILRRYSNDNIAFSQPQVKQDYRRRSLTDYVFDYMPQRYSRQYPNRNYFQREISPKFDNNYVESDRWVQPPEPEVSRRQMEDDMIVEVRIPSRYLKPKEVTNVPPSRYNPRTDRHEYTKVLPHVPTRINKPYNQRPPRETNQNIPSSQPEVKQPMKKPEDIPKDVFQGDWPMRNEITNLTEFNKRALLHDRDPFLWRPVDTNFGYDVWHDAKF